MSERRTPGYNGLAGSGLAKTYVIVWPRSAVLYAQVHAKGKDKTLRFHICHRKETPAGCGTAGAPPRNAAG